MAWPFSSVVAPNADSGFAPVPAAAASPTNFDAVSTFWLMGGQFSNGSNQDAYVTITDGAGNVAVNAMRVPAYTTVSLEWAFMPIVGVKWSVGGGGSVTGKLWGYV